MVTKLLSFKTRQQQTAAKKSGRIDGYFGKVAKGHPASTKISMSGSLPMNKTTKEVIRSTKKGASSSYANWSVPANFALLKSQVIFQIRNRDADNDENTGIMPASTTIIPRTTLQRASKHLLAASKNKNISLEAVTCDMIFPQTRGGGKALLHDNDIELLGSTIIYRDEANNGMSQNEAIQLVMELSQTTNRQAAETHYDYLV